MTDNRPIGIFDSGVGGLTMAHGIHQSLPDENLIFFGDTAHLPYGDKSNHAIRHFSEGIIRFLLDQNCKAIIIACNTASSVAYPYLKKKFGSDTLIINVIDPVVAYCLNILKAQKIGVIGTKGTIRSRAYPKKFRAAQKDVKVTSATTPLLAPMIEEGFYNNNISQTIINTYLSKKQFEDIEVMILACTHYPLIKAEVEKFYKGLVDIVDNTKATVNQIKGLIEENQLGANEEKHSGHYFYISDYTKSFQETAKLFFQKDITLEEKDIWGI